VPEKRSATMMSRFMLLAMSGCWDGRLDGGRMNCEISTANRATNDIRFMVIVSGETRNLFGFLDSTETGYNATSLGCDLELSTNTTIEWEENDKKCSAIVDMAKYIPKKRLIKSFSFL